MASTSPPLFPAAARLGGYEIVGLVGRGGMGEVYRAKQISMEREVALKILSPRLAKVDPAFADQFVAEARAAGKLNHPNIVGVHDVGHAPAPEGCDGLAAGETVHYFSMEFIEGETVKDVIERQGAVDLPTIAKVMTAMAEALAFAEAHKIVHRDIKPDNIMLTSTGLVKLADLGLALQADSAEAVAGSKDDQGRGKVMGTPLYMAPEQARAQPIDHRADQYALGATLFHMLTGRPPYQGDAAKAIMRSHCFDPVPDPAEINPQVPPPWRDLCQRMMAKAPEERFAGANDLRSAIKATVRWKPGTVFRNRESGSQPPWLLIVVAAGLALAALWWFVLRAPPMPPVPPPGPTAPDKPVATSPTAPDAAAKARAAEALAGLSEEPSVAITEIDQLLADPSLAPAKSLLLTRRELLRGAVEERRRNAIRSAAEAVEGKIAAGQLGEARDGFARLPDEAWFADRRKLIAERLSIAERTIETRLAGSIETAEDIAACDKLAGEITRSGLPEARKKTLTGKLDLRRRELAKSAPKTQKIDSAALWRELGERVEQTRGTLPYSGLGESFVNAARNFPDPDRPVVEQLAIIAELAQQAEAALRLHIGQATPKAECRFGSRSGTFLLTKLDKDKIGFRLLDVPAETSSDRATAVVPWAQLLTAAVAGQAEGPRQSAAFLWFWRQGEARAALARLKDDPLVTAIATLERRTRAINIAGDLGRGANGQITVSYAFAESQDAQYLTAWQGQGAELVDRGLHWATATLVESKAEADLPSLRWKAALRLPLVLEATVQPDAASEVVLLGLTSGKLTLRVGLNPKRQAFILATKADASGTYEAISGNIAVDYNASELSRVRISVDAAGKFSATVNDKALGSDRELAFPADAKLSPVIQARGVKHGSGVTIGTLTVSGKL